MASKTDICNRALAYLGASLITSIDDESKSAHFCRLFYNDVLEDLLRTYPWDFAIRRVELNPVAYPLADGLFAFQLPSACLRPLYNAYNAQIPYKIEDRNLVSRADTFTLVYIELVEDVNKFDTMFRKLLSLQLAIELCESMTGDNALESKLIAKFNEQRAFTQNVDSQDDNETNYLMEGEMLNVRLGSPYRGSYDTVEASY